MTKRTTDNEGNINNKQYAGGFEYYNDELEAIYFEEGRIAYLGEGEYRYEYSLKDHLGNTRVTFADVNNDGRVEEGEILQEEHYYPFGLRMEGYGRLVQGLVNPYNYNGKELISDFDLDWLDYGARWYDASIARWSAVDPLAEKYAPFSPYNYVLNNPISNIDPDGRDVEVKHTKGKNGKKDKVTIKYRGVLIDKSGTKSKKEMRAIRKAIKKQLKESFTGEGKNTKWKIKVKLRIGKTPKKLDKHRESTINLVDNDFKEEGFNNYVGNGSSTHTNGFDAYVNINKLATENDRASISELANTAAHEAGHTMGLPHLTSAEIVNRDDFTLDQHVDWSIPFMADQSKLYPSEFKGNLMVAGGSAVTHQGTNINESQILHIVADSKKRLNKESHSSKTPWGFYSTDNPVYEYYINEITKSVWLRKK